MSKTITYDTLNALMSNNRKKKLLECGYSEDDIKDTRSLYNALRECSLCAVRKMDNRKLKKMIIEYEDKE